MKCKRCNSDVREGWRFCPKCGTPIAEIVSTPIKFNFSEGIDFDEDFEEVFWQAFKEVDKIFKSMGFPGQLNLTIRTGRPTQMRVSHAPIPKKRVVQQQKMEQQPQKIIKSVEEPEMKMQTMPNYLSAEIKLPSVKSIQDISIKKIGESIEVRAYAGEKMYFKLIPLAQGSDISEKKFVNSVLTLKMQK